jgi:hypothetical protein
LYFLEREIWVWGLGNNFVSGAFACATEEFQVSTKPKTTTKNNKENQPHIINPAIHSVRLGPPPRSGAEGRRTNCRTCGT